MFITNQNTSSPLFPQNASQKSSMQQVGNKTSSVPEKAQDVGESIERAINESVIHKLFSALSRAENSTFKNYDRQLGNTDSNSTTFQPVSESYQFHFNEFSSQTFELDLSLNESSFSVDFSFSRIESSEIRFSDDDTGISFTLSQTTSESFSFSFTAEIEQEQSDPLILDLDFNGFSFTNNQFLTDEFDLNADGVIDNLSHLDGADAYLAIDLNKNGQIDNGLELFGDADGSIDGFANLAQYDDNNDGLIDAKDRIFDQLLLLRFAGQNQQTTSLAHSNVLTLSLSAISSQRDYGNGNELVSAAEFTDSSGNKGRIGDFLLGL